MSGKTQIGSYSTLYACACKPCNQVRKLCLWASPTCTSQALALMQPHINHVNVCTHLRLQSVITLLWRHPIWEQHGDASAV